MKLKTKNLIILVIVFFAMLIGAGNVKAETHTYYTDYYDAETNELKKGTITVITDGQKVTEKNSILNTVVEYENIGEVIRVVNNGRFVMKQAEINKFINNRDINYTFKKKVGNEVESATVFETNNFNEKIDVGKMEIQTIDNEKWIIYKGTIHYKGELGFGGLEATGSKTRDIATAIWDWSISYYTNENKDNQENLGFYFDCISESIAGYNTRCQGHIVNKRDVSLEYGGSGGGIFGYTWLYPIYNSRGESDGGTAYIPKTANLSEIYMKICVSEYQGEVIELSNNKGTLYYEGKGKDEFDGKTIYIYKNALSNLKIEENETPLFNYKLGNGITIPNYAGIRYRFDENAKDKVVEVNDSTKNEQNIKEKIGITYWGDAKFDSVEIDKNDSIYDDVKENVDENSTNYEDRLYLDILDIYRVSGDYGGKLTITFNVGEQYNGKYYCIAHRISYYDYEFFEGIVENGKITITVDSLSPFGIAIYESKLNNSSPTTPPTTTETPNAPATNKGEKDETPKTGTMEVIKYILPITLMSAIGIVLFRKKKDTK